MNSSTLTNRPGEGFSGYPTEVVGPLQPTGDVPNFNFVYCCCMQLVQIGVDKQKTIMDMIQEMAARQFSEMEQLKAAARSRASRRSRRSGRRCGASQRQQ